MTDEKAAKEWADKRCPEQGPEFIVWRMCYEDHLAGQLHGAKAERERIGKALPNVLRALVDAGGNTFLNMTEVMRIIFGEDGK